MAAMLFFLLLLLLLLNSSNSDSSAVDIITVHSGEAVRLLSGLTEAEQKHLHDIRWTHSNLLLALKNNMTKCNDGRCELLADGTLSFSHTEKQDSGKYLMQAFDKGGKRFKAKEILLQVNSGKSQPSMTPYLEKVLQHLTGFAESTTGGGSSIVAVCIATGCVFLILFTAIHYFMMRRRAEWRRTAGRSARRNSTKISADD